MVFQDFVVIQLVHTVTGSDDHIGLMASFQEIQVLIDGICCTLIPEAVLLGDGRCEYEHTALFTAKVPPFGGAQVLV